MSESGKAVDVRPLGRDVGGQTVGVVPQAERAARLHRRDAAAVTAETFADDDVGGIERFLHLGIVLRLVFRRRAPGKGHLEDQVVVPALMDDRRARLQRRLGIADVGQLLVVDFDRFGGVLGHVLVARDDGGERIAVEAHLAHRERPVGRVLGRHVGHHHRLRQGRDLIFDVVARDHRDDARHGLRLAGVDTLDPGVGHLAAHEHQVHHARHHDVADIAPATGEQPLIFLPIELGAEPAVRRAGVRRVGHLFAPWKCLLASLAGRLQAVAGDFAASRTASTMWT